MVEKLVGVCWSPVIEGYLTEVWHGCNARPAFWVWATEKIRNLNKLFDLISPTEQKDAIKEFSKDTA